MPIHDPITGRTWLNSTEAAAFLGVTLRWLKRNTQAGLVPFHKRGHLNMFRLDQLEQYEQQQQQQQQAKTPDT